MRYLLQFAFLIFFLGSCAPAGPPESKLNYPVPRKGDVVQDYHGTNVADPYRWMEDLDAKETADWVAASNTVTEPYLAQRIGIRSEVDALLGHLVDQGLQGLLLFALSRAAQEQGTRGCARWAGGVLPHGRYPAIRRQPDLRTQGSARVDHQRQRDRG